MSKNELNYEADLEIDPDDLDNEWLRQPILYMKYAEAAAEARRRTGKAEEKIKVVRSKLITKADGTAQKIEAYYRTHPDHVEAKEELIEAQYQADVMSAAEKAFEHRKRALENLVRLEERGYFASPQQPKNSEIDRRSRGKFGEGMRKSLDDKVKKRRREN